MKNKIYDGALATLCVFLFLAIGCAITALCLLYNATTLWNFPLKYLFAVICGAFLLVYLVVAVVCIATKRGKNVGLSFIIVFAGTFLISLSPLALLMWIFQKIIESVGEKKATKLP